MGGEISDVIPKLHAFVKLKVEKVHVSKKVCKDPSSLTLIKMLGFYATLTEKVFKRQKITC